MLEIISIPLENEMDLVVAGKRSIKIADFFELSLSSQTAFSTAISEICRDIIGKHSGLLTIFLQKDAYTYHLVAQVKYENIDFDLLENQEGLHYAKRLISQITVKKENNFTIIEMRINVPKTIKLRDKDPKVLIEEFHKEEIITPYEEVKKNNILLHKISKEQIQKLAESEYLNQKKNEFFSIASHELKTPLTSIKAYAQIALQAGGMEAANPINGYLKKIDMQASKLNRLIQQLLDISKIETGKLEFLPEQIGFNGFLEDTVTLIKDIHPDHFIHMNLGTDCQVHIDKLRIEQVLVNIIGNAAKYSKINTNIYISSELNAGSLTCTITDEGIGMSVENTKNVFKKFFRDEDVSKKYSGFGMGLYISSKIVEDHKGSLWVESTPGKGSSFHFTLPL